MKAIRMAVLNSHPIQYFAPLYAFLNSVADLDVTALYMSDISLRGGKDPDFGRYVKWDLDLLSGYRSVFLGKGVRTRDPGGFWSLVAPQVWRELRSGRYDVLLLHGHNYAANHLALIAAKSVGMPVMMRGETHLGLPRDGLKALIRRPVMATLYGMCDRLLAIGSANADFYRAMGVSEDKIFLVPYAVDNDRFMRSANLTPEQRAAIRRRYNVPLDRPAVLYAAKFTPRKRPADLLEATRRMNSDVNRPFTIVMTGSGELEHNLRGFCEQYQLKNVIFTGFVNQSELPALYGASDIFVLPSEHEPWGLAVNEAMCASLPVVVSREVGCVRDLVSEGANGFAPATGDVEGLGRALRRLIEDDELRKRQGEASFARIRQWSYNQCLDGIRSAVSGLSVRDAAEQVRAR